jgi:hypothetical protein
MNGKRFGRLLVTDFSHTANYHQFWNCVCDCGKIKPVREDALIHGKTVSCGCVKREMDSKKMTELRTTHGLAHTPVYNKWCNLKARCTNPKNDQYHNYGGRGIKVCPEWLDKEHGFENFYRDMGEPPSDKHQIDRKDNSGAYSGKNCHWVLSRVNNRNKRNNKVITFNGESKTAAEWSEVTGIGSPTIRYRLFAGWSEEKTLTTPVNLNKGRR